MSMGDTRYIRIALSSQGMRAAFAYEMSCTSDWQSDLEDALGEKTMTNRRKKLYGSKCEKKYNLQEFTERKCLPL